MLYNSLEPISDQNVQSSTATPNTNYMNRWHKLLSENDPKSIWKAINWKGDISNERESEIARPSDHEFKKIHFENLLNPPAARSWKTNVAANDVSIPV